MWLVTSNDRKMLPSILRASGVSEDSLTADGSRHYGAAIFAAGNQVLTNKQPTVAGQLLAGLDGTDIRSNRFLGCLSEPTDTAFRSENVQPFRYKDWVMGINGDAPPELSLPKNDHDKEFVRHHVRGNTTHEVLFHTILARLYRTHPPGHAGSEPRALADAVKHVVEKKALKKYKNYTIAFTCETAGIVVTSGRDVKYRTVQVDRSHLSGLVVVDGLAVTGREWKTLKDDQVLLVGDDVRVTEA